MLDYLGMKSDKVDSSLNKRISDILHKQIRHLTIIMIELLKSNLDKNMIKVPDQEYINEKKSKILFRQGLSIAKWINKFCPEDIKDEVYDMPNNLQEFDKFVNSSLDEIGEYLFSHTRNLFKRKNTKSDMTEELKKLKKFLEVNKNRYIENKELKQSFSQHQNTYFCRKDNKSVNIRNQSPTVFIEKKINKSHEFSNGIYKNRPQSRNNVISRHNSFVMNPVNPKKI